MMPQYLKQRNAARAADALKQRNAARAADALKQRIGPIFVIEDPNKFGPGAVVVEDGKNQRMMITKIVAGFAVCIWFESYVQPRTEAINVNMLTLDRDQKWEP
jgi:hypothetical protein